MLGVLFFLFEIGILQNPKKHLSRIRLIGSLNKKDEDGTKIDLDYLKKENDRIASFIFMNLLYLFWSIMGAMFSGQWILFLCLIAFGFFAGFYKKNYCKNNIEKELKIIKIDAFVSSILVATIVINHFHHIF